MAPWFYRALESVSMASALSTTLTIYPCQIRVHQTLTVLNSNFLQLGRRSGGRPQPTLARLMSIQVQEVYSLNKTLNKVLDMMVYSFQVHCCHMAKAIKHSVPDRVKLSFVIFDIRALWRSAMSVRVPGYQKLQMTANPSPPQDALLLYPYGNTGCQRVKQ